MPTITATPDLIAPMPHWLQVLLVVLGAVVPVASLLASIVNAYVRTAKARGEVVPTWLLALAVGVNVPALNPDKSVEAVKTANAQAEAPQVPAPSGVPTMTQAELFAAIRSSTGVPHPLDPEVKP